MFGWLIGRWSVLGGRLVSGFKETHFEYVCVICLRRWVFTCALS